MLQTQADDRPNIIVLLCDDLGYGDLQCYGHPHIKTPHLDALAEGGIRFTDFYSAAPVCSPSRVGLLTGRSPNRAGVYDWIPEARQRSGQNRVQVHMRSNEITIPQLLGNAGYQTCMAGKWHCNAHFNNDLQPQPGDFGFDHWLATQNNAAPSHENPENFVRNGKQVGKVQRFSCQYVMDEAIEWLGGIDRERPFFLYLPFHEPHEPVASPEDLVRQYQDVAERSDQAQYFANVANVDAAVGRLIESLDRQQLRDNTLVVFTSDNGPETLNRYRSANRSFGSPGELRGMKLHTTEAGFRVAGIMNWPGKIEGGQTSSAAVSSLDFLPTFCELAETTPPKNLLLDGTSFLPALEGQPVSRKRPLVWAYYNALNEYRVAMRSGAWKVLGLLDDGNLKRVNNLTVRNAADYRAARITQFQLYNLAVDPTESNDLASSKDPQIAELKTQLVQVYDELVQGSHVWQPPVSPVSWAHSADLQLTLSTLFIGSNSWTPVSFVAAFPP